MSTLSLYRGAWPQNVSKLAKYAVRFVDGQWTVTVLYNLGNGERYLAVEGGALDVAAQVNSVKKELQGKEGGTFYVNEYRHILVAVAAPGATGTGSHYYPAGRLNGEFRFEYEGRLLTGRPIRPDGAPLKANDPWVGPRPGIPYVLAAGAGDIYYETPSLTDENPPRVKPMTTRKVYLSKVMANRQLLPSALAPISAVRGHLGGRFYVNEYGAIFTPVAAGDGNGIDFVYCGQISLSAWFPEPRVE
jgi:hypothetical protein